MSWTQEVERLTSTEEDEVEDKMENGMRKDETEPTSDNNQRALREKEWMRLFRQKVEIARQMRYLETELTDKERLGVFDKVKYA